MSRTESVPTSRRLRLHGREQSTAFDRTALDELGACLDGGDEVRVDAVEITFDHSEATEAIEALEELDNADYDVEVRELVVEVSR